MNKRQLANDIKSQITDLENIEFVLDRRLDMRRPPGFDDLFTEEWINECIKAHNEITVRINEKMWRLFPREENDPTKT